MSQNTTTSTKSDVQIEWNTDKAVSALAKIVAGAAIDTALVAVLANQELAFTTEYTSKYTYFGKDCTTTWTITLGDGRIVAATATKHFEAEASAVIAAMV